MYKILAKFKNNDWEEVDHTNPDSDRPEDEQAQYLIQEYKMAGGQAYMVKAVQVEDDLVPA